jgi:hypothetical protein
LNLTLKVYGKLNPYFIFFLIFGNELKDTSTLETLTPRIELIIMGGVPSVPKDPSRPLKVIGAGYSRTGTLSMALALEKLLNGLVMHGGSQLPGREDGMVDRALLVVLCISNQ